MENQHNLQEEPVVIDLQQEEQGIDYKSEAEAGAEAIAVAEAVAVVNNTGVSMDDNSGGEYTKVQYTKVHTSEQPKETTISDELIGNSSESSESDDEQKELVVKPDETKIDIEDPIENDTETLSYGQRFIKNWAKVIFVTLAITTLTLVGVLIGINKPEEEAGIIVGLVCFNMVLSAILMPCIGILFIKFWTKNTWWLVFFIVYIAIIADTIAFGTKLQGLSQVLLILYGVIKILLIVSAFMFAKIDGKHFIPSIISRYITMDFIKQETQLYKLIPFYVLCLLIQLCMFSIGCMAFVIDDTDAPIVLLIVALVLFIWLINTPRHFLSYVTARLLAKYICKSERESINENDNVVKLAFNEAYNKFVTITIGSFCVTTTPLWYFIVNLMTGIRIVTAALVICCAPCADRDEEDHDAITCVASLIACVAAIANGIAWVARKISKWTLRVTAKLLLISAGLLNITFWEAIVIQNTKIKEESKNTFGSDMLFLDNVVLSNNTHLCILISSIGAWLTYVIKPEATVICWIGGYCACRTMFEMVDVILLTFLIAWFVEPRIIYDDKILLEDFKVRMREMVERLFPDKNEEFYVEAIQSVMQTEEETISGLQKTTDPTHVTNLQSEVTTVSAAKETKQVVHASSSQVVAAQTNTAVMIHQETKDMDHPSDITQKKLVMTSTAITYPNNDNDQLR